MVVTSRELAAKLGVEYIVANSLLRLLEMRGIATLKETRPNPRGKGRGSKVYEVPEIVTLELRKIEEVVAA